MFHVKHEFSTCNHESNNYNIIIRFIIINLKFQIFKLHINLKLFYIFVFFLYKYKVSRET